MSTNPTNISNNYYIDSAATPSTFEEYARMNREVGRERSEYELNPNSIPALATRIHKWAQSKGWRGPTAVPRSLAEDIALIDSETAEALEAFRASGSVTARWYTYETEVETINGPVKFTNLSREQLAILLDTDDDHELDLAIEDLALVAKPEGVGSEFADTIIRILDTCENHGINILAEILEKMNYNETRAFRHGGKHL